MTRKPPDDALASLYLHLLKVTLTRLAFPERLEEAGLLGGKLGLVQRALSATLEENQLTFARRVDVDIQKRSSGQDWPREAETMIGMARLGNLEECIRTVVHEEIPGDLIETGVWRGGAGIFMRGALAALHDQERTVWMADSFTGLPAPNPRYPVDAGDEHHTYEMLAVSLQEVKENFRRYGLLDDRVRFLEGWFVDTLPHAPIERLAVIRLDGDMYGSTIEALEALYPKLSPGGFVIVDDFALRGAREAVVDFRRSQAIHDPMVAIDWTGAYWRRGA